VILFGLLNCLADSADVADFADFAVVVADLL
jgi:hypothetical protein